MKCLPRWCLPGGGVWPGGVCPWGVCPGRCLPGGVCPGGCLQREVFRDGGVCRGGVCPGGCLPGGFLPAGGVYLGCVCHITLPPCEQIDRRLWKHNLSATTLEVKYPSIKTLAQSGRYGSVQTRGPRVLRASGSIPTGGNFLLNLFYSSLRKRTKMTTLPTRVFLCYEIWIHLMLNLSIPLTGTMVF